MSIINVMNAFLYGKRIAWSNIVRNELRIHEENQYQHSLFDLFDCYGL